MPPGDGRVLAPDDLRVTPAEELLGGAIPGENAGLAVEGDRGERKCVDLPCELQPVGRDPMTLARAQRTEHDRERCQGEDRRRLEVMSEPEQRKRGDQPEVA